MLDRPDLPLLLPDELREFRRIGVSKHFEPDEKLIYIGTESTEVFYVVKGVVKIVVLSDVGQESAFGLRASGEFVGEMSTLSKDRRSADVVAVEPTETVMVGAARFLEYLERNSGVALAMLRLQSRRLGEMTQRRVLFGSRSVKARVALTLITLGEASADGRIVEVDVKLKQADLAAWIDASREWTSRALGELRDAGYVRTGRGRVTILDFDGLRAAGLESR